MMSLKVMQESYIKVVFITKDKQKMGNMKAMESIVLVVVLIKANLKMENKMETEQNMIKMVEFLKKALGKKVYFNYELYI